METAEYEKLHNLESHYWWHRGRRRMILGLIEQALGTPSDQDMEQSGSRLLGDIGCGTGSMLQELAAWGRPLGFDFSSVALEICKRRGNTGLVRADAAAMPAQSGRFDLLTALDVVEHVGDDRRLLSEFCRVLKPGGYAIISVPAHPFLWSGHDLALHHYRRYTKSSLKSVIQDAGLDIQRLTFGMLAPLIPALGWRLALRPFRSEIPGPPGPGEHPSQRAAGYKTDEAQIPKWLNQGLGNLLQFEASILKQVNLPAGLSLLCIAQKPGRPATTA